MFMDKLKHLAIGTATLLLVGQGCASTPAPAEDTSGDTMEKKTEQMEEKKSDAMMEGEAMMKDGEAMMEKGEAMMKGDDSAMMEKGEAMMKDGEAMMEKGEAMMKGDDSAMMDKDEAMMKGDDSAMMDKDDNTTPTGNIQFFKMTAKKWAFDPSTITVKKGDTVVLSIESIDVAHGISISEFDVLERLEPGVTTEIEFVANKTGSFSMVCSVFCGSGHSGMKGTLIVE
jgi:cytochrome c oxidase subunit II